MEVFEIHITGDESIHNVAKKYNHKTITIDLLRPNNSVIRTEHMTSLILKYPHRTKVFEECKELVDKIVENYKQEGVKIIRVKIESPFDANYVENSVYLECHFLAKNNLYPISRNQRKTILLATDREYDKEEYLNFIDKHENKELELCLYDTFPTEDLDWMSLFEEYHEN